MYLYEKNNDEMLDVYSFYPKEDEIKKYKKQILNNTSKKELVLFIRTNCYNTVKKVLNSKKIYMDDIIFDNYDPLDKCAYSALYSYTELDNFNKEKELEIKRFINKYINNEYTSSDQKHFCVVKDYNKKKNKYFFITNDSFNKKNNYERNGTIEYILNLPSSLYLLYLLENGYFNELGDRIIKKQLELFKINKYHTIKIDELSKLYDVNLLSYDEYNNIYSKIDSSSKILKKIKSEKFVD